MMGKSSLASAAAIVALGMAGMSSYSAISYAPTRHGRGVRYIKHYGHLRKTKGWTGGARYKGSAKAKRATKRGGNPAVFS